MEEERAREAEEGEEEDDEQELGAEEASRVRRLRPLVRPALWAASNAYERLRMANEHRNFLLQKEFGLNPTPPSFLRPPSPSPSPSPSPERRRGPQPGGRAQGSRRGAKAKAKAKAQVAAPTDGFAVPAPPKRRPRRATATAPAPPTSQPVRLQVKQEPEEPPAPRPLPRLQPRATSQVSGAGASAASGCTSRPREGDPTAATPPRAGWLAPSPSVKRRACRVPSRRRHLRGARQTGTSVLAGRRGGGRGTDTIRRDSTEDRGHKCQRALLATQASTGRLPRAARSRRGRVSVLRRVQPRVGGRLPRARPVPPAAAHSEERAVLTAPPELSVAASGIPQAGRGVWARVALPRALRMGPYQGVRSRREIGDGYSWEIRKRGRVDHYVDAFDTRVANWMRFVNCARHEQEQNVEAFQFRGAIFYRSMRALAAHEELLVWYGDAFALQLGISPKDFRAPLLRPLPRVAFACSHCSLSFTSPL